MAVDPKFGEGVSFLSKTTVTYRSIKLDNLNNSISLVFDHIYQFKITSTKIWLSLVVSFFSFAYPFVLLHE